MFNNLKIYLLNHIDNLIEKGHIFSHIDELNLSTNNDKSYMTFDYNIQHPMQAVELKVNMNIAKNSHLIISLNRSHNHPLIRKYSHIAKVEK